MQVVLGVAASSTSIRTGTAPGHDDVRLANDAWEALYRAQMTIARELRTGDHWAGLLENEYAVLYALAGAPDGLRMVDLAGDVLITQAGLSRLVGRMEERGLVQRTDDPDDGRACRIRLTDAGAGLQRRIGLAHARQVAQTMTDRLDGAQLRELLALCRSILTPAERNAP